MQSKQAREMQSGRSMVEMLGVLTVMGLLTTSMILGMRYALAKTKANQIIKDARLAHTMLLTKVQSPNTAWADVSFQPSSGKNIQSKTHLGKPQVKVPDVPQSVCEKLFSFGADGTVKFFTTDQPPQELTSCADNQDIIIELDANISEQGTTAQCETKDDCENGYCEDGACVTCPDGQTPNQEGTGCTIFCDVQTQYPCYESEQQGGRSWCCNINKCAPEFAKCVQDTVCSWTYTQSPLTATCSATYSQDPLKATCSVRITTDSPATTQHSSGNNYNGAIELVKRCPGDQYCYVQFTAEGCGDENKISDTSTGLLWGVCNPTYATQNICTRQTHFSLTGTPCPSGTYCSLNFTSQSCGDGNKIADNSTGTLWGTCVATYSNEARCVQPFTMTPDTYCPAGQYCLLNWESDTACGTIGDSHTGKVYGRCIATDKNTGACPYPYTPPQE